MCLTFVFSGNWNVPAGDGLYHQHQQRGGYNGGGAGGGSRPGHDSQPYSDGGHFDVVKDCDPADWDKPIARNEAQEQLVI